MVKDCEKLEKKKEEDAQQGKTAQKKTYPKCGTCGKTNRRNDVGRVPARIFNLSAQGPRIRLITIPIQRLQNPTITQYRPSPSLHPRKTSQQTSFATTPIRPTSLCPTIHQIVTSNTFFHNYKQQLMGYPSVVWQQQMKKLSLILIIRPICSRNQFLFGILITELPLLPDSGPFP